MSTKILAIDCGLRMTGVALAEETEPELRTRVVASDVQDLGRRQAAELPLMTEKILNEAGWSWDDLNLLAVTSGPGYFTGLRVGAAYVTGLAFALGVRIATMSSLEMLTRSWLNEAGDVSAHVLALVYASRNSVYAASYFIKSESERESGREHELKCDLVQDLEIGEYTGEFLTAWLAQKENADVIIISDDPARAVGAMNLSQELAAQMKIHAIKPDASSVALYASRIKDTTIEPEALRLIYCRSAI